VRGCSAGHACAKSIHPARRRGTHRAADKPVCDPRLLAHELAHVLQQRANGGGNSTQERTLQRQSDSQGDNSDLQCGVRTVTLPSPGTASNYVVLKSGPTVGEGIIFLTNVGKCRVFIHSADASGNPLDPTNPLVISPSQYVARFVPQPNSAMIVGVADDQCSDNCALSYDPCAGII
jgi:hypothetical protein